MISGHLKPQTPAQWIKLALIPVLSLTMLVLLWRPSGTQTDETALVAEPSPAAATAAGADLAARTNTAGPLWPKVRLDDVIAFNPFEAEQASELEETVETYAARGELTAGFTGQKARPRLVSSGNLQAIFVDAQGAAAIIDAQVFRIGDTLPTGGRVVEITADGIKLEGL